MRSGELLPAWPRGLPAAILAIAVCTNALAAEPPPVTAFARMPELEIARLSPDGSKVAWMGHQQGREQVAIYDLQQKRFLRRIHSDATTRLRALDWADSRTLLMTVSRTQVYEYASSAQELQVQLRTAAVDADGGDARVLLMRDPDRQWVNSAQLVHLHTGEPGRVVMASYDFHSTSYSMPTGSRLKGGRKDEGWLYSLFSVDTRTGNGRLVEPGTPYTQRWIVDGRGQPVARSEWNSDQGDYRILVRQAGTWKTIYRSGPDDSLRPIALTQDGRAIAVSGSLGGDHKAVWRLPLDGGDMTPLVQDDEDAEEFILDRYTGALAGVVFGGLDPFVRWLDPKMEQIHAAVSKAFPGLIVQMYDRSEDYRQVLARVEGPANPPVYYLVDLSRGTADTIGESYPELAGVPLGTQQKLTYRARDGMTIPAYLTLPPGAESKALPLVVMPHGGPFSRDRDDFDWWMQFVATRGYAVFQPQFRGSTGFGEALLQAGTQQWGRAMQNDVTDGVQHLIERGIADPRRICIVGWSYGGFAALAGAAFTPELYACAASVNGVADLAALYGYVRNRAGDESDARDSFERLIGAPYKGALAAVSPTQAVARIRAPILLIHAESDTVVPVEQSEGFAKRLREQGKDHQFLRLPGDDHSLSTASGRLRAMQELETFLSLHLRPPAY